MKTIKASVRVGSVYNPKTGAVYQTRDTLNALRLLKLARAMDQWKKEHQADQSPAIQRKVKAIGEVL